MTAWRAPTAQALAQVVYAISPALLPKPVLTSPATIGDTSLVFDTTAGLVPGSFLLAWDGTPESMLLVKSVQGNTAYLDFTGQALGLQANHLVGATFSANLLDCAPQATGPGLQADYPVIGCFAIDDASEPRATGSIWQPHSLLRICYLLPSVQSANPKMNSQLFYRQQQHRAENDGDTIQQAIIANPRLVVNGTGYAQMVRKFTRALREENLPDAPRFELSINLLVENRQIGATGPIP